MLLDLAFLLSLGNFLHRVTKLSLKSWHMLVYIARSFGVTSYYVLQFIFKQLYGIFENNPFKQILQFFLVINFRLKVIWEEGWKMIRDVVLTIPILNSVLPTNSICKNMIDCCCCCVFHGNTRCFVYSWYRTKVSKNLDPFAYIKI